LAYIVVNASDLRSDRQESVHLGKKTGQAQKEGKNGWNMGERRHCGDVSSSGGAKAGKKMRVLKESSGRRWNGERQECKKQFRQVRIEHREHTA
jgi:hypothetical protein